MEKAGEAGETALCACGEDLLVCLYLWYSGVYRIKIAGEVRAAHAPVKVVLLVAIGC